MRIPDLKIIIRAISVLAVFLLSVRKGPSVKLFDFLIVMIGFLIFMDPEARTLVKTFIKKSQRVIFIFLTLICFIAIAQYLSYARGNMIDTETLKNYGRALFNIYALLLVALLVVYDKKILSYISWAIVASPVLVLPAFWNLTEGVFIGGGRLAGFLQQPIIFGAWIMVVYLIGIATILSSKKIWQRVLLIAWLSVVANFILWSASRAAWVALAITLFSLVLILYKKRRVAEIGLLALICAITFSIGYLTLPSHELYIKPFVSSRAENLAEGIIFLQPQKIGGSVHLESLSNARAFIVRHPLGIGFGGSSLDVFVAADRPSASNNSYLEVTIYGGIGALLAFALFLWEFGRGAWSTIRSEQSLLKVMWIICGIAFLIDIFFTQAFLWRHLWFTLGIGMGIAYEKSFAANSV